MGEDGKEREWKRGQGNERREREKQRKGVER